MVLCPAEEPKRKPNGKLASADLSETLPDGQDKVARYGWTVKDKPGELRYLHKSVLEVDASYQRDAINEKVVIITRTWSWAALGAIVVAERGGRYYVMDGQHRVLAALRRSDVAELPCVVFQTESAKEEAQAFLTISTQRKPMTAIARLKTMAVAEDSVALIVHGTIERLGIRICGTPVRPRDLKCVGWCLKRAADDRSAFVEVLTLGTALCAQDNLPVAERVLEGLWYLNKTCGEGLGDPRLVKRLREKGGNALLQGATRAAAYFASGGGKVWAQGMLTEINKGLKEDRRFTIADGSAGASS